MALAVRSAVCWRPPEAAGNARTHNNSLTPITS